MYIDEVIDPLRHRNVQEKRRRRNVAVGAAHTWWDQAAKYVEWMAPLSTAERVLWAIILGGACWLIGPALAVLIRR